MGVRLIREVLEHAPADLSTAERLVLLVLAEDARDETRECWPDRVRLRRRTGMREDALRKTLSRLATRDLEVRVALGTDKRDRPVFAHEGKACRYRVPRLASGGTLFPPLAGERQDDVPTSEDQEAGRRSHRGGNTVAPLEPERQDDVPTHPVSPSEVPSDARDDERDQTAAAMTQEHGWPLEHCRRVVDQVLDRARQPIVSPRAYVLKAARSDPVRYAPGSARGHADTCEHGKPHGMRVTGRGAEASRHCERCDQTYPVVVEEAS